MNKKQKSTLARIILAFVVYIAANVLMRIEGLPPWLEPWWAQCLLFLVPYVIIGGDIVVRAFRNIAHGQVFDENFLMMIATFGAFVVGEYSEGVAVMLFYQVGELFQSYAVNRSRQSITELMDICPDYANIEKDGQLIQVDPDDVAIDDVIVVKPGERIPLDGKVVSGNSMIDTSALTGESVPRSVGEGAEVISGCVNGSGLLKIQVTKIFEDSTVSRILEMVENASAKKAPVENFITKFARYYTPAVVIAAVALAVISPLFMGLPWSEGLRKACIFLVISCPCALVISVPLSFFGGIGAASRQGVLVKGSNYLEALAEMETIVFDKTGTLTKGEFKVTEILPEGMDKDQLLALAAQAESYSDHPIAQSIKNAYGKPVDTAKVGDTKDVTGHGVSVTIGGSQVLAGNGKLMTASHIAFTPFEGIGTVVYIAKDNVYAGCIVISDTLKPDAKDAIDALKASGVGKTVMLTGDKKEVGEAVGQALGIDEIWTELLPGDKVEKVEALLKGLKPKEKLAFVGDGINDAPVLSRADIGIAMGSLGSDAAIEAADIVLMDDQPSKIATVVRIARGTLKIVKQNIVFALAIKALVLILGAFGIATMWEAVFADVGVSVLAILNAMRALRIK